MPDGPSLTEDRLAAGRDGHADLEALADLSAGRLVDSDAVARWLGGWHLARTDEPSPADDPKSDLASRRAIAVGFPALILPRASPTIVSHSVNSTVHSPSLLWTQTAIRECDRLRQTLATLGREVESRLAAALVGVMVRLIVDGPECRDGIFDVTLLPTLGLRIASVDGDMTVLGPRSTAAIV